MRHDLIRPVILWLLFESFEPFCFGQSPAGSETLFNERLEGTQIPSAAACTAAGTCAAIWPDLQGEPDVTDDRIFSRALGPTGALLPLREIQAQDRAEWVTLTPSGSGFMAAWDRNNPPDQRTTVFQPLTGDLLPAGAEQEWLDRPSIYYGPSQALAFGNGFAVLWTSTLFPQPDPPNCPGCNLEINLTVLEVNGDTLAHQVVNDRPGLALEEAGSLSLWPQPSGPDQLLATYRRVGPGAVISLSDVFVRGFTGTGEPLGSPMLVNTPVPSLRSAPQVAAARTGEFVVVWDSDGQDGSFEGIFARHFNADGSPKGAEFQVNNVTLSQQVFPKVAMDAQGNFVIAWSSFEPIYEPPKRWEVKARLFRADGTPVSDEIAVNQYALIDQLDPKVAFAPNGTFFVTWTSGNQAGEGSYEDVYARRFSASPGEEVCWVFGPALSCDLGRTGGAPELALWAAWATAGGGVPLTGDFDGDGREDLCSWNAGLFRCDLDHEGRPLEGQASYGGLAGDTPLLARIIHEIGHTKATFVVRRSCSRSSSETRGLSRARRYHDTVCVVRGSVRSAGGGQL